MDEVIKEAKGSFAEKRAFAANLCGGSSSLFLEALRAIVLALSANAKEFQSVEQHLEPRLLFA